MILSKEGMEKQMSLLVNMMSDAHKLIKRSKEIEEKKKIINLKDLNNILS